MIPFKINGKSYKFPSTWEDVTFAQYMALLHAHTITDQIAIFTGISRETLEQAELRYLERINTTLSFLYTAPKFDLTARVGPYYVPPDVTIQSTVQFEALRGLLLQMPKELKTTEGLEQFAELALHACAIYCQKVRDRHFDYGRATIMKEQLRHYSCAEVIGTGSFFLFKPLSTSRPIMNRFRSLLLRLRRWIQGLPGYQKTLDLLQRSTERREK
jgi:hypothetical protein